MTKVKINMKMRKRITAENITAMAANRGETSPAKKAKIDMAANRGETGLIPSCPHPPDHIPSVRPRCSS